ncbi:NnrU family protein [Hydrogenophaga sp. 5NK40-0174]|uniref:NnrU family protein n=1 Tax=Hydrogenophaga sp. 5NK40-0174 TaxID=3127649 RepID=UPI003106D486
MWALVLGLVIFLGAHSVAIVAPEWRLRQMELRGERGWKSLFSVVSFVGLGLIIWGYGQARLDPVAVFSPPVAMRHVAALLMAPVFVLLAAAHLPGRISAIIQHPMLTAVKFWALAHLLANGMLADLLLFGGFLAWAVADRISVKRRARLEIDGAAPVRQGKPVNDVLAVALGLVVYVVFALWLHGPLMGVRPFG